MRLQKRAGQALAALFAMACFSSPALAAPQGVPIRVNVPLTQSSMQQGEVLVSLGHSSDGARIRKANDPNTDCAADTIVATGDLLVEANGSVTPIAIVGDVTGSGQIGLTQLIRLAQAQTGSVRLDELQSVAGGLRWERQDYNQRSHNSRKACAIDRRYNSGSRTAEPPCGQLR